MAKNPYVNKVVLAGGSTLIDLTSDTVTSASMLSGTTAHDASGAVITGSLFGVGSLWATRSSTDNPATVLGFGTWQKIAPSPLTWNDIEDLTWNNISGVTAGIYVWERTA